MSLVETLYQLSADPSTVLSRCDREPLSVVIHQHQHYRWVFTGGRSIQSVLSLNAPSELFLPNQLMMLVALLLLPTTPAKILNLGFGGGSFERFFLGKAPTMTVVSVDIDAELVAMARRYLLVPASWPVIICAAEDYLRDLLAAPLPNPLPNPQPSPVAAGGGEFELILVDIFQGEYHADCLNSLAFYRDSAANLSPNGVMALNLVPQSAQMLSDILTLARLFFAGVMLTKIDGLANIVMVLSKQHLPTMSQLQLTANDLSGQWSVDFAPLLAGFKLLPAKT